jgi:serine/threonine protein kinase
MTTRAKWILDETLLKFEGSILGAGSFGAVFKATYEGSPVAAKIVDISKLGDSREKCEDRFHRECAIQYNLCRATSSGARNVAHLYGATKARGPGNKYYIVMELLQGSLTDLVLSVDGVLHGASVWQRIQWLHQAADALQHMHANNVAHADLKPDNILLAFEDADEDNGNS